MLSSSRWTASPTAWSHRQRENIVTSRTNLCRVRMVTSRARVLCDEQLLDVFLAVKRIAEERELLIERRDRERESEELDNAYDASTNDEAERQDDVASEQQASGAGDDELDAPSDGHMSGDDASALPESGSGGDGCDSSDQQGHVLLFGYDPILICLTPGCNRRRRVAHDRGYVSPRCRGGRSSSTVAHRLYPGVEQKRERHQSVWCCGSGGPYG